MFKPRSAPRVNRAFTLPNPRGGFNPSASLMAMRADYAPLLENWFAAPDGVETRDGYVTHITAIPKQCDRLLVFSGVNGGESLWGCTNDGIYNFNTAGACPAASIALTNGKTFSTAISTGAGNYMLVCNGTDTIKQYDGTTWTSIPLFGATATSIYSYIETYRQRIFLVKRSSLEIEYLASNSIGGAAINYPLGALFRKGGYIVAICVWTVDGGIGPEDHLAVYTSQGELAIFAGNDPATWALTGVYQAGRPLGDIPMYKYGGDVLLLSETGITPCSSLIQSASIDRVQTISTRIRPYLIDAGKVALSSQGWQIISDPLKPMLMVNLPTTIRTQAVMESQLGGWSTFTGWNAFHFARKTAELYFSDTTGSSNTWKVKRITGYSDDGTNITATMLQAYNEFGYQRNKKTELVKPYFNSSTVFLYNAGIASDFQAIKEFTQLNLTTGLVGSLWGSAIWGTSLWAGEPQITTDFQTVPDEYSRWKALYIQTVSRLGRVKYLGSDILFTPGGDF